MTITTEESEAYRWAIKTHGNWDYVAILHHALRRHVAAEMRLEFEIDHETFTPGEYDFITGALALHCSECGQYKNFDSRHNYSEADWDRAAHEALTSSTPPGKS